MKLKKLLPLAMIIVSILLSFLSIIAPSFKSYPLGERVEYLGVESFGRTPFTDSPRYDLYYYGTDVTPEELAKYFHATASKPSGDPNEYDFKLASGTNITLWFYKDKTNTSAPNYVKNMSKKYFFYIHDQNYEALKNSINN